VKIVSALILVFVVGSLPVRADELSRDAERIRRALQKDAPRLVIPADAVATAASTRRNQPSSPARSDTVWEGVLIGAAIGGVGGYVWARNICGSNDTECFVITAPVGVLGGGGIGALIGAVADKLHK
jgi:hypothetical protein